MFVQKVVTVFFFVFSFFQKQTNFFYVLKSFLCLAVKRHFLSFLRELRKRRRVGGRVHCLRFGVELPSHRQVRVGLYGTAGSTALNRTACLPLRAGPTPLDPGEPVEATGFGLIHVLV